MEGFSYRQLMDEANKRHKEFIENANKRLQELLGQPSARFHKIGTGPSVVCLDVCLNDEYRGQFIGFYRDEYFVWKYNQIRDKNISTLVLLADNWDIICRIYRLEYTDKLQ